MRLSILLTFFTVLLLVSIPAYAGLITVIFSGTVTITHEIVEGSLPADIFNSMPFTGSYSYDTSVPDTRSELNWGIYEDPSGSISASIGSIHFTNSGVLIEIYDDATYESPEPLYDSFAIRSESPFIRTGIEFYDHSSNALASDSLLLTAPDISHFQYADFGFAMDEG